MNLNGIPLALQVHDAIRAASVDGYSQGERAAVRKAAAALRIGEVDVADMEQLVADEQALRCGGSKS